jgi:DNA-directed RNA polymerase sigma subunit (sigma70/sigma32)
VKIALNFKQEDAYVPDGVEQEKALERDVLACKRGDWEAKSRLFQTFMPLFTSIAKKRTQDTATINRYIEAGKDGLMNAVRHFKHGSSAKFQIFALVYIETAMDRINRPGLFAWLFKRS